MTVRELGVAIQSRKVARVRELAELLTLIGCGPLASRTPINNDVP